MTTFTQVSFPLPFHQEIKSFPNLVKGKRESLWNSIPGTFTRCSTYPICNILFLVGPVRYLPTSLYITTAVNTWKVFVFLRAVPFTKFIARNHFSFNSPSASQKLFNTLLRRTACAVELTRRRLCRGFGAQWDLGLTWDLTPTWRETWHT